MFMQLYKAPFTIVSIANELGSDLHLEILSLGSPSEHIRKELVVQAGQLVECFLPFGQQEQREGHIPPAGYLITVREGPARCKKVMISSEEADSPIPAAVGYVFKINYAWTIWCDDKKIETYYGDEQTRVSYVLAFNNDGVIVR